MSVIGITALRTFIRNDILRDVEIETSNHRTQGIQLVVVPILLYNVEHMFRRSSQNKVLTGCKSGSTYEVHTCHAIMPSVCSWYKGRLCDERTCVLYLCVTGTGT